MAELRKSLLISFGDRYAVLAVEFVSTLFIARLLAPAEIGIYSVAAAAVAIAHGIRNFGVTSYLIQEGELTGPRITAAFITTSSFAWTMAAVVWLGAPAVAAFYHEPGIQAILRVVAINFALIPFGSVALALLRRELRFDHVFFINVASSVVRAVVAITLAMLGLSFMSLAWGGLAGVATMVAGALVVSPTIPRGLPRLPDFYRVVKFGGGVSIASIASEVGNGAPDLIFGRMLGFATLGYFSRALGFVQLFERAFTDGLRPVMLPYFSRERRAGRDLGELYTRALEYMISVAWPALAVLAVLAEPLIRLLYGPQWDAAVPLAYALCVAVAFRSANPLSSAMLVSAGAVTAVVRVQLGFQLVKVILLIGGAWFGLSAALGAFVVAELIGAGMFYFAARATLKVSLRDLLLAVSRAAAMTGSTLLPVLLWLDPLPLDDATLIQILQYSVLTAGLGAVFWLSALLILRHPLSGELARVLQLVYNKLARTSPRQDSTSSPSALGVYHPPPGRCATPQCPDRSRDV